MEIDVSNLLDLELDDSSENKLSRLMSNEGDNETESTPEKAPQESIEQYKVDATNACPIPSKHIGTNELSTQAHLLKSTEDSKEVCTAAPKNQIQPTVATAGIYAEDPMITDDQETYLSMDTMSVESERLSTTDKGKTSMSNTKSYTQSILPEQWLLPAKSPKQSMSRKQQDWNPPKEIKQNESNKLFFNAG